MQVTKFVESYFDAWNHEDAQAVAAEALQMSAKEEIKSRLAELLGEEVILAFDAGNLA